MNMLLAHIFGLPVEETVLPWLGNAVGCGMLTLAGASISIFLRRRR